jgi:hypothetical protein
MLLLAILFFLISKNSYVKDDLLSYCKSKVYGYKHFSCYYVINFNAVYLGSI